MRPRDDVSHVVRDVAGQLLRAGLLDEARIHLVPLLLGEGTPLFAGERAELTMTIGGYQRMGAGAAVDVVQPHNHRHVLGRLHDATAEDVSAAIEAALGAVR